MVSLQSLKTGFNSGFDSKEIHKSESSTLLVSRNLIPKNDSFSFDLEKINKFLIFIKTLCYTFSFLFLLLFSYLSPPSWMRFTIPIPPYMCRHDSWVQWAIGLKSINRFIYLFFWFFCYLEGRFVGQPVPSDTHMLSHQSLVVSYNVQI